MGELTEIKVSYSQFAQLFVCRLTVSDYLVDARLAAALSARDWLLLPTTMAMAVALGHPLEPRFCGGAVAVRGGRGSESSRAPTDLVVCRAGSFGDRSRLSGLDSGLASEPIKPRTSNKPDKAMA